MTPRDIVERLRAWVDLTPGIHELNMNTITEAADEIERFSEENKRLRAEIEREKEQTKIMLDSYADENQRISDKCDKLRAALEKIANGDYPHGPGLNKIKTIARAALSATKGE